MVRLLLSGLVGLSTLWALVNAGLAPAANSPTFADPAFAQVWNRTDQLVASGLVARTWFWGPQPNTGPLYEAYAEAPGGQRLVQYFDKSRMEINQPGGDPNSPSYVTNGRLTVELISGQMAVGETQRVRREPAAIPLSGDSNDLRSPTYASLAGVADTSLGSHPQPDRTGQLIQESLDRSGAVRTERQWPAAAYGRFVSETGHNVASIFWDFLQTKGPVLTATGATQEALINPWSYASGLPISDPYWTEQTVRGAVHPVLVQAFERRVLTYGPDNAPGFQVEMGNIGQHYYTWRYGSDPPITAAPTGAIPTANPTSTATTVATGTAPANPTGTATALPPRVYGVRGQGGLGEEINPALLRAQYAAGVRGRLVELGWNVLQPDGPTSWDVRAAQAFQDRIDAFVAQGPDVKLYLDLGLQYPPAWVKGIDPLVDQYGTRWQANVGGGVNVYWSPTVRAYVAAYIERLFTRLDFHNRLWIVRVGTAQGELIYPEQWNNGQTSSYWAFDSAAQASSPVPGWRPGQPSPNNEAQRFYEWYVDNLAGTFTFLYQEIRRYYTGYVAPVTPGSGVWEGTAAKLISRNLADPDQAHAATGNYWQRIFARLPAGDKGILHWCSSVGDRSGTNEQSPNWWDWSSARQQAYLAHQNGRDIYGENPGRNAFDTSAGADPGTTMQWIIKTAYDSGYLGLLWLRQEEMDEPGYATLEQYGALIRQYP